MGNILTTLDAGSVLAIGIAGLTLWMMRATSGNVAGDGNVGGSGNIGGSGTMVGSGNVKGSDNVGGHGNVGGSGNVGGTGNRGGNGNAMEGGIVVPGNGIVATGGSTVAKGANGGGPVATGSGTVLMGDSKMVTGGNAQIATSSGTVSGSITANTTTTTQYGPTSAMNNNKDIQSGQGRVENASEMYNMRRPLILAVNVEDERDGADHDTNNLDSLFRDKRLGFDPGYHAGPGQFLINPEDQAEVERFLDEKWVKKLKTNAKGWDGILVILMGHGTCKSGKPELKVGPDLMSICDIIWNFTDLLEGFPKVFLVNCCLDAGLKNYDGVFQNGLSPFGKMADVFVGWATSLGKPAYRDPKNGTIFIQHLCRIVLEEGSKGKDIGEVLRRVNREMPMQTSNAVDCLSKKLVLHA